MKLKYRGAELRNNVFNWYNRYSDRLTENNEYLFFKTLVTLCPTSSITSTVINILQSYSYSFINQDKKFISLNPEYVECTVHDVDFATINSVDVCASVQV